MYRMVIKQGISDPTWCVQQYFCKTHFWQLSLFLILSCACSKVKQTIYSNVRPSKSNLLRALSSCWVSSRVPLPAASAARCWASSWAAARPSTPAWPAALAGRWRGPAGAAWVSARYLGGFLTPLRLLSFFAMVFLRYSFGLLKA